MNTQQHDESLHPREQTGRFATKAVTDAPGGLDALAAPAPSLAANEMAEAGAYLENARARSRHALSGKDNMVAWAALHLRGQHVAILAAPELMDAPAGPGRDAALDHAATRHLVLSGASQAASPALTAPQRVAAVGHFFESIAGLERAIEAIEPGGQVPGPVREAALLSAAGLAVGDAPQHTVHMYHRIVAATENEAFDAQAAWAAIDQMRDAQGLRPIER